MADEMVTPAASETPAVPAPAPATPTPVATTTAAKVGAKRSPLVIIGIILLILLCCCGTLAAAGYFLLKNGDITLNGVCYKGIDNVFANKTVPCPPPGGDQANGGTPANNPPANGGNPAPAPAPTPAPPSANGMKTFVNANISFQYPSAWKISTDGDAQVVTTPEGDTIRFNGSVAEDGALSDSTCKDFADQSLSQIQSSVSATASLVHNAVTTVGVSDACVFDIDTTAAGQNVHLRYVYVIKNGKGYLVTLSATDDSTLQSDMLDVVDSLTVK